VLTDFFLDNRVENVPPLKPMDEHVQDGNLYPDPKRKGGYRRFEITETGISPRAVPGMEGFMFTATGLEHTEKGMPDYTPENHMAMSEKRHRKIMGALRELPPPEEHAPEGPLDVGVVTWGSSVGAALEAVRMARKEGMRVGGLKITTLFPYHADKIRTFMGRCKEVLVPELNYGGQLSNLIGHLFPKEVVRLNYATGVPIFPKTIFDKIKQLL
jgi:2-oxoglutarate ferredoxin oxidoreductase subunit alpha